VNVKLQKLAGHAKTIWMRLRACGWQSTKTVIEEKMELGPAARKEFAQGRAWCVGGNFDGLSVQSGLRKA
jgi:hypothetical protein